MAAEGATAGAEGLDAYCIFDPAYLRNYACLSVLGLDREMDLATFRVEFGMWLFAGTPHPNSPSPLVGEGELAPDDGTSSPPLPRGRGAGGEGAPAVPPAFAHFDTLFDSSS